MANRSLRNGLIAAGIGAALVGGAYLWWNGLAESKVLYLPLQEEKEIYGRLVKVENRFLDKMSNVVMEIRDITGEIDRGFEISLNDRTNCITSLEKVTAGEKSVHFTYTSLLNEDETRECIKREYLSRVTRLLNELSNDDPKRERLQSLLNEINEWE